jgi:hypothetical protein
MKFTIDRSKWLRGEDAKDGLDSYLLRPSDGKQCCVGIYLSAIGFLDDELHGRTEDTELRHHFSEESDHQVPHWLCAESEVYGINDSSALSEPERERRIAERFAAGGVTVEFVDGQS